MDPAQDNQAWSSEGLSNKVLAINNEHKSRIESMELELSKQEGSMRSLQRELFADKRLLHQFMIAFVLTFVLAGCYAVAPLFLALVIQVLLGGSDGWANFEKIMSWETSFLLVTFVSIGMRGYMCAAVKRRVAYRVDLGLAAIADKARRGECSVKDGQAAAHANHDRISKTVAWATISFPLDVTLHIFAQLFCILYLSSLSWKMGTILIVTVSAGGMLGLYIIHLGRMLNEIEKQLSDVAGSCGAGADAHLADEEADMFSSFGRTATLRMTPAERSKALNDLMSLEGTFSAAHSAASYFQYFVVFNASLLALYFGASKVIENRDQYTPENLLIRLLYFIATMAYFIMANSTVAVLEEALPQCRVVARLQSVHQVISPDLVRMMQRKRLVLKDFPKKLCVIGVFSLSIMVAWLAYLVNQGGYGCDPLPATCLLIPAERMGPVMRQIDQTFSLAGGGCVLKDKHQHLLDQCATDLVCAENDGRQDERGDQPVDEGLRLVCATSDDSPQVLGEQNEKMGHLVHSTGEPSTCREIERYAKKTQDHDDIRFNLSSQEAKDLSAFVVKLHDPVPTHILSGGAGTSRKVRLKFDDWSNAPAFFEDTLDRLTVTKACNLPQRDGAVENLRRLREDTKHDSRRRIMKGKLSAEPNKPYEAKLRVQLMVLRGELDDTLSAQLFVGEKCPDPSAPTCRQKEAMPMTVLGSGKKRTFEVQVPTRLPRLAVPCSVTRPLECFSSVSLLTSGRKGFQAALSFAVIEDGEEYGESDDEVKEDVSVTTVFRMETMHRCEGSAKAGTLGCALDLTPAAASHSLLSNESGLATPLELPQFDRDCKETPPCKADEQWAPPGDPPPNPPYYKPDVFEHVVQKFDVDEQNHDGDARWDLWVFKQTKSAVRFAYRTRKDCGCHSPSGVFELDSKYQAVQQSSTRPYPKYCGAPTRNWAPWSTVGLKQSEIADQCNAVLSFAHGRLIPSKIFNHNKKAVQASFQMIGVLPQASVLHQQAWAGIQEIIDCMRDLVPLHVIGGAVFDSTALQHGTFGFNGKGLGAHAERKGDEVLRGMRRWFWATHAVESPTYFWVVLHPEYGENSEGISQEARDLKTLAFWIPNNDLATRANLSKFVVSVNQLQQLINAHGRLSGSVMMKETFRELGASLDPEYSAVEKIRDGSWSIVSAWMKHVNQCPKAGPQEPWKREYCRMKQMKMPGCGVLVDGEEIHCATVGQDAPAVTREYIRNSNTRCRSFREDKKRILEDLARQPTTNIKTAAVACTAAVKKVCQTALSPMYSEITKAVNPNHEEICEDVQKTMFQTGSLVCDPKVESFGDCEDRMKRGLRAQGRSPELEAIMREHVLKCMCVSWRSNGADKDSLCYQGSMGIPAGKKWCQFDKVRSWQELFKKNKGRAKPIPSESCNLKEKLA